MFGKKEEEWTDASAWGVVRKGMQAGADGAEPHELEDRFEARSYLEARMKFLEADNARLREELGASTTVNTPCPHCHRDVEFVIGGATTEAEGL